MQIQTQRPPLARVGKIAAGLARPSTRSRYVAEIQRRIKRSQGPSMPLARPAPGSCRVCGCANVDDRVVSAALGSKQIRVMVCRECGHVAMPENLFDYTKITSETQFKLAKRVGTAEMHGREFGMTAMAADILRRSGLDVLMYGVGRSADNIHV